MVPGQSLELWHSPLQVIVEIEGEKLTLLEETYSEKGGGGGGGGGI